MKIEFQFNSFDEIEIIFTKQPLSLCAEKGGDLTSDPSLYTIYNIYSIYTSNNQLKGPQRVVSLYFAKQKPNIENQLTVLLLFQRNDYKETHARGFTNSSSLDAASPVSNSVSAKCRFVHKSLGNIIIQGSITGKMSQRIKEYDLKRRPTSISPTER